MNTKTNLSKFARHAVVAAVVSLPAFAMAGVDVEIFNEAATEIDKLEDGVKVVGSAIVGVTIVGAGYKVVKRWVNRV